MKKLYLIKPDDKGWGAKNDYIINASHGCGLPGVRCPACGPWTSVGLIYPSISCERFTDIKYSLGHYSAEFEFFQYLLEAVRERLDEKDKEITLKPGTDFGPLIGNAWGNFGDFTWQNQWTPLVRSSVFGKLLNKGLALTGVKANLKFRKKNEEPLIELEVRTGLDLHPSVIDSTQIEICPICGIENINFSGNIVIDKNTINFEIPIQRIKRFRTQIIIVEEFASVIKEMQLKDIVLKEICVA